jgi:queuosine precursor transporter
LVFSAVMSLVVTLLPIAPGEHNAHLQTGLETVFGNTWRIALGSIVAFWAGSLANSYVLAPEFDAKRERVLIHIGRA